MLTMGGVCPLCLRLKKGPGVRLVSQAGGAALVSRNKFYSCVVVDIDCGDPGSILGSGFFFASEEEET